jgi:hypothetical protein
VKKAEIQRTIDLLKAESVSANVKARIRKPKIAAVATERGA